MCGQRKHHLSEVTPRVENKRKSSPFAQNAKRSQHSQCFTTTNIFAERTFFIQIPRSFKVATVIFNNFAIVFVHLRKKFVSTLLSPYPLSPSNYSLLTQAPFKIFKYLFQYSIKLILFSNEPGSVVINRFYPKTGCWIPIRHFFSQSRRLLTKIFESVTTLNEKCRCL
jgi:hypothetical protein